MTDPQSSDHPHTPSVRWSQSGCLTITWSPFVIFPTSFPRKSVGNPAKIPICWGKSSCTPAPLCSHHTDHTRMLSEPLPPFVYPAHPLGDSPHHPHVSCQPLPTLTHTLTILFPCNPLYSHCASLTALPSSNPCYTSLAPSGACLHPEPSMCPAG